MELLNIKSSEDMWNSATKCDFIGKSKFNDGSIDFEDSKITQEQDFKIQVEKNSI